MGSTQSTWGSSSSITQFKMKFALACVVLACLSNLELTAGQLEVTVTKSDFNRAVQDRFCCLIAQSRCTAQCAGQSCDAQCVGRCGIFGFITCGPYTCSGIASSTCTTTTTTTTTPTTPTTPSTPTT